MPGVTRLSVRNIRKSFGTHEVLRGISLDAQDGDVISLLGASGSGKSTFLRCINLLETATSGEIWVDGEEIRMVHKSGRSKPAQHLVPRNPGHDRLQRPGWIRHRHQRHTARHAQG